MSFLGGSRLLVLKYHLAKLVPHLLLLAEAFRNPVCSMVILPKQIPIWRLRNSLYIGYEVWMLIFSLASKRKVQLGIVSVACASDVS